MDSLIERVKQSFKWKKSSEYSAEKLGMTLVEVKEKVSTEELIAWSAYFSLKGEREEKAYEDSKKQAQYRRLR